MCARTQILHCEYPAPVPLKWLISTVSPYMVLLHAGTAPPSQSASLGIVYLVSFIMSGMLPVRSDFQPRPNALIDFLVRKGAWTIFGV